MKPLGHLIVWALLIAWLCVAIRDTDDDMGAGRALRTSSPAETTLSARDASGSSDSGSPPAAAGALSLTESPVEAVDSDMSSRSAGPPGRDSGGTLASLLSDLEEPWRPTPEGLYLRTTELWSQEDFLRLTPARVEELLGETIGAYPTDLREYLGADLPTLEDCQRALEDEYTAAVFEHLIVTEAKFSELCETPVDERSREMRELLRSMKRSRDETEDHLMRRLDATSSYKHWRLLSRLYLEWQK